jgi:hypothetical protein
MGARPSSFATPVVEAKPTRQWSKAQEDIFGWFDGSLPGAQYDDGCILLNPETEHLVVRARAGCLAGDTYISINRAGKGWSLPIAELAAKVNGVPWPKSKGWDLSIPTMVQREQDGAIRLGKLKAAWASGLKQTYVVTADSGRTIRATDEHPFMAMDGWYRLDGLKVGMFLLMRGGQSKPCSKSKTTYSDESDMWNHPYANVRPPDRTHPKGTARVPTHRLVVEADRNRVEYQEFLWCIRSGQTELFTFLDPAEWAVHHIDRDTRNNTIANLSVLTHFDHHYLHGMEDAMSNVLFKTMYEQIVSIEPFEMEETFDIEVEDDPHNFIANGFVVHNTGKTTTIIEGVDRAPEAAILVCAFNKRIADELNARLSNPRAEAKTLHSLGLSLVRREWRGMPVNEVKVHKVYRSDTLTDRAFKASGATDVPYPIRRMVTTLHTKAREMCPLDATSHALATLAAQFDLIPDEGWRHYDLDWVVTHALLAMHEAATTPPSYDVGVDYADMIYLPLVWNLTSRDYQLVVVDECLPGWTPVMLHDGTSLTIQEIVESDQPVIVRSYDTTTGEARNCRVTARQKMLNQKPLVKVSVRYKNNGRNFVTCTVDHKLWTANRGWVEAGQVQVGDTVIVETAAKKSQRGKITAPGRANLSAIHRGNRKGIGNKGGDPVRFAAIKGGNGRGLSLAEQVLSDALGPEWTPHFVMPTGSNQATDDGLPTHYKLDIANEARRIAVEVDGRSHSMRSRKMEDQKKEWFLESQGWTVFRVSNLRAVQNPHEEACRITGNCPHPATVVAVDPVVIRDNYVYDITVEDCHNFYANGILVHNCQDMTAAQLEIAERVCDGRICIVGDDRQAIYGFRGADSNSLNRLKAKLGALELPLNTTYRCGTAIVAHVQRLVPDIMAGPTNPAGLVDSCTQMELLGQVRPGDFVLSRLNAPLVSLTLRLLRNGVRATMAGRDVGAGVIAILKKLKVADYTPLSQVRTLVEAWERKQVTKLASMGVPEEADRIRDQADVLYAFIMDADTTREMLNKLDTLFTDTGTEALATSVLCSSVHKAKGCEAERVFVLTDTFYRRGRTPEEDNCMYVAVTRAKTHLTLVKELA